MSHCRFLVGRGWWARLVLVAENSPSSPALPPLGEGCLCGKEALTSWRLGALIFLGWPLRGAWWLWDSKATALCHLYACAGCSAGPKRHRHLRPADLLHEANGRTDGCGLVVKGPP